MKDPLSQIGDLYGTRDWPLQLFDQTLLSEMKVIEGENKASAFAAKPLWRLYGTLLGLILGVVAAALLFRSGITWPALAIGAVLGIPIGLFVAFVAVLGSAIERSRKDLIPQVARRCGGVWHEEISADQVPLGNPVSCWRGPRGGDKATIKPDNELPYRWRSPRYREMYENGITGQLPGHEDRAYGIFKFVVKEKPLTSKSEETTTYVIAWVDVAMPFENLELKRRGRLAGSAVERMSDRVDTDLTEQKVLELESEDFNRLFKVELPDGADDVLIRRMFSPAIQDAMVRGLIDVPENVMYHNGRIWIVDKLVRWPSNPSDLMRTVDYMIYRAQLATTTCLTLARQAGRA